MHPFEAYLKQHHLEALTVAIVAQVRYIAVWRATKGYPIQLQDAKKIRQTLVCQTGCEYIGPLALAEPESLDQLPMLPIRKLPRHNLIYKEQGGSCRT